MVLYRPCLSGLELIVQLREGMRAGHLARRVAKALTLFWWFGAANKRQGFEMAIRVLAKWDGGGHSNRKWAIVSGVVWPNGQFGSTGVPSLCLSCRRARVALVGRRDRSSFDLRVVRYGGREGPRVKSCEFEVAEEFTFQGLIF